MRNRLSIVFACVLINLHCSDNVRNSNEPEVFQYSDPAEGGPFSGKLVDPYERQNAIELCWRRAIGLSGAAVISPSDPIGDIYHKCESASGDECYQLLAYRLRNEDFKEFVRMDQITRSLLQRICDGGQLAACSDLKTVVRFRDEKAVQTDACVSDNAEQCLAIGNDIHEQNLSLEIGRRFIKQACILGSDVACKQLGNTLLSETKEAKGTAQAKLKTAWCYQYLVCARQDRESCEKAIDLYDGICNGGKIRMPEIICDMDGRDRKLAESLCKVKSSVGCYWLGVFQETGWGGTVDKESANKAYKTACEMGEKRACDRQGGK